MKNNMNSSLRKWALCLFVSAVSCHANALSTGSQVLLEDPATNLKREVIHGMIACAGLILFIWLAWQRRNKLAYGKLDKKASPVETPVPDNRMKITEEEDFKAFLAEFRSGTTQAADALSDTGTTSVSKGESKTAEEKEQRNREILKEFFTWAPDQNIALSRLVEKSRKTENPTLRQDTLVEICARLALLKSRAGIPNLRPAWEMATAIEGLLKQLTHRASNNTPSTLRTLDNGMKLLADLCVPDVRQDLACNPAIKILVVDDDQISRLALTSSVKRAFEQPDLAESGEAALGLASKQRYDLIMLDVMMPGMDGFEVCAKIRETLPNRSTPVLFITALQDFNSRSKLIAGGGNEVMGKPFMAVEVTVKALTLILRSRLSNGDKVLHVARESATHSNPSVSWPKPVQPAVGPEDDSRVPIELPPSPAGHNAPLAIIPPEVFSTGSAGEHLPNPGSGGDKKLSEEFLTYMPFFVSEVKQQVATLGSTDESAIRKELAIRLHLRLQCLSRKIDVPLLRPAFEVSRSLEGLFKKFMENPKNITETSVRAVNEALDLLKDLCRPGVRPSLSQEPPIKLLVVDDEPLARRALTGALQMAFSKPFTAETGEEALELAVEHDFDVIFMDVCMPGMDGFAACSRIHEIARNHATPVMFVTSLSDQEFRDRAAESGGSDFIVKPFIFMEINLKSLTIALRGRLKTDKRAQSQKEPALT